MTTSSNLVKLNAVNFNTVNLNTPASSLTPDFSWNFEGSDSIDKVNLFVSSFDEGEGLLPWDKLVNLSDPKLLSDASESEKLKLLSKKWQGGDDDDFNPGRILTATWQNNRWLLSDGTVIQGDKNHFTLPDNHRLTAGQNYHWAVQGVPFDGKPQTKVGHFDTKVTIGDTTSPFSSVTILTHGFSFQTDVPDEFYQLGNSIIHQNKAHDGLMLRYDVSTGNWIPVNENGNPHRSINGWFND